MFIAKQEKLLIEGERKKGVAAVTVSTEGSIHESVPQPDSNRPSRILRQVQLQIRAVFTILSSALFSSGLAGGPGGHDPQRSCK